ncbi:cupin-like domain-containing protein [Flocculibacter collagenilyticus]|uniref:cupin-like domain-containing protein n=1 Tax=Flocculibacter collagenilyticus TaxID=2744479 RepID=UPI0018F34A27|nr:cupin-like domain-containing protein [Flocculibacter collagenilyticus]
MDSFSPIRRIKFTTKKDLEDNYLSKGIPVIVEGALENWAARTKWSPNYFKNQYSDIEFNAEVNLREDVPVEQYASDVLRKMTIAQFIDHLQNKSRTSPCYISNKSVNRFPNVADDIDFESLVSKKSGQYNQYIWLGSEKTKSSLHFDFFDNIMCQIYGRKKVYLVNPKDSKSVYQYHDTIQKSKIDIENIDFNLYPKMKRVNVTTAILKPGEIIFVPKLWWHTFVALDISISINLFYGHRATIKQQIPTLYSAGTKAWGCFAKDFIYHGLLKKPQTTRLYTQESFGTWYYKQVESFLTNRIANR